MKTFSIPVALATTLGSFAIASMVSPIHSAAGAQQSTGTNISIVSGAETLADKAFSPNPI